MDAPRWIRNGFVLAALVNLIGVPICTRGLTNETIYAVDPERFSPGSLAMILVWGVAYLGLAKHFARAPWVVAAFALEKLYWGVSWIVWMAGDHEPLATIWATDWMAGFWYAGYGVIDGGFGIFFVVVLLRLRRSGTVSQ